MRKLYKILIGVAFAYLLAIGYVIFYYAYHDQQNKIETPIIILDTTETGYDPNIAAVSEPPVATLTPKAYDYTPAQIFSKAETDGEDFCQTLDSSDSKACTEYYWSWRAEMDKDPTLCNRLSEPGFVRQCKQKAATVAVALVYYNESNGLSNDVVPSNVALCDLIEYDEDRSYCLNPQKAFDKNIFDVVYKVS